MRAITWGAVFFLLAVSLVHPVGGYGDCGDGVIDPGETCDPPDPTPIPGTYLPQVTCRPDCTFCGDDVVQSGDGESCEGFGTVGFCTLCTLDCVLVIFDTFSNRCPCLENLSYPSMKQARAEIAATCDCAGATRHGDYVRCVSTVLKRRVKAGELLRECARVIRRCEARSTCGRAGTVTCCRTSRNGTLCSVKRDAASCTAPHGGEAHLGNTPSCCDACP
jgi:hypothetical protein